MNSATRMTESCYTHSATSHITRINYHVTRVSNLFTSTPIYIYTHMIYIYMCVHAYIYSIQTHLKYIYVRVMQPPHSHPTSRQPHLRHTYIHIQIYIIYKTCVCVHIHLYTFALLFCILLLGAKGHCSTPQTFVSGMTRSSWK